MENLVPVITVLVLIGGVIGTVLLCRKWKRDAEAIEEELRRQKEQKKKESEEYQRTKYAYYNAENDELKKCFGDTNWNISEYDFLIPVKSRQALENYDMVKFFKEGHVSIEDALTIIEKKEELGRKIQEFLQTTFLKDEPRYQQFYRSLETRLNEAIIRCAGYRVKVMYISAAGNNLGEYYITITARNIEWIKSDPSLLMTKTEYSKYLKEKEKEALEQKQRQFYDRVNAIIDLANQNRDSLLIKNSQSELDNQISSLFDRTVNTIKKVKKIDSEEWDMIENYINQTESKVQDILRYNRRLLNYYDSDEFKKIKETVGALMSSQREFNEYIEEKAQSISKLFGCRITRNETQNEDANNYIRPYKKTINPFVAEVSDTVFGSAENAPLEYVVKYFYPNKAMYPEQIQKLYHLVEELETLREAKSIIEEYKSEYNSYIKDVPQFVLENDEAGFYKRLGFAYIAEDILTVEYKFSYTSNGGMAQRSFTVPMNEENIVSLIRLLESKLTATEFSKEQRRMMTRKLRESIKERDDYTCCICGNSIYKEPHLLLEIDHIVPIAAGGKTEEANLQTLCWQCNRSKGSKTNL